MGFLAICQGRIVSKRASNAHQLLVSMCSIITTAIGCVVLANIDGVQCSGDIVFDSSSALYPCISSNHNLAWVFGGNANSSQHHVFQ